MDAQTLVTMRCTACGVLSPASCSCGAPYEVLSPGEVVARRRTQAKELYEGGMTQDQIAAKLKVDQKTVSRDLDELGTVPKSKRGRPRGSKDKTKRKRQKPPGVKQAQRSIDLDNDTWEQVKLRAEEADMTAAAFIGALLTATINPEIDLKTLSKTAQNKVEVAIRQATKRLEREFEERVRAEVKARNDRTFPLLQERERMARKNEQIYREFLGKQKKIMTVGEYTQVCSCLHPDSRGSVSEEKLKRVFQMFEPLKFALTGEK